MVSCSGMLTAGGAAGQLMFLPVIAIVAESSGWRTAALGVAVVPLAVVPLVLLFLRERPRDLGVTPYGGTAVRRQGPRCAPEPGARPCGRPCSTPQPPLPFWYLAAGMMPCGATTMELTQPPRRG